MVQISLTKWASYGPKQNAHIKWYSWILASAHLWPHQPTKTHKGLQYLSSAPFPPFLWWRRRRKDGLSIQSYWWRPLACVLCSCALLLEYDSSERLVMDELSHWVISWFFFFLENRKGRKGRVKKKFWHRLKYSNQWVATRVLILKWKVTFELSWFPKLTQLV